VRVLSFAMPQVARQMFLPPDPVAVDKLIETGMEDAAFDWVVDAIDSITPKVLRLPTTGL
jgi:tRNA A37 threonylcarbamoyladenosine dehydratase